MITIKCKETLIGDFHVPTFKAEFCENIDKSISIVIRDENGLPFLHIDDATKEFFLFASEYFGRLDKKWLKNLREVVK